MTNTSESTSYLPAGMPYPAPAADGLDTQYWEGAARDELWVQRCSDCESYQWGPEWICHECLSFNVGWIQVEPRGRIYSWERSWHPVHAALAEACPYVVVLVELPGAGGVRMVGNLLGEPTAPVEIGAAVEAVFEHHRDHEPPYTLVQWRVSE